MKKMSILTKILFVLFALAVIFHQVIIHLIQEFFKKPKVENYKNLGFSEIKSTRKPSLSERFKKQLYTLNENPTTLSKPGELYFKNNKFLPDCCYTNSNYSSSNGCPCITPDQQDYLLKRGSKENDVFEQKINLNY